MRTPEEVKKALRICNNNYDTPCDDCQYAKEFACIAQLKLDALEYIEALEAKVPKWVHKEDGRPKCNESKRVLVCDEDGYVYITKYYRIGHFFAMNSLNEGLAVYWMELPTPPKEETTK